MNRLRDLTFVALDVETTGLDPSEDAIIEVGAVAFTLDGERLRTFQRLVDPRREIPEFVVRLTGIGPDDVRGAPAIEEVIPELEAFVGEAVLVGQNVEFDLAHLCRAGFRAPGPAIDTAFLARALLRDRLPSRTLSELAAHFGIAANGSHRALADAETAAEVFLALLREAWKLDDGLRLRWAELLAFDQPVLAQLIAGQERPPRPTPGGWGALLAPVPPPPPPLRPADQPVPVTRADIERAFAAAARVFDEFEERPEQREMAEHVRRALVLGGRYLIEAGTGVGKSLAYLLPAALYALRNQRRVVVSTHTLSLQDQLLQKDIPLVRRILVEAGFIPREDELRVTVLKGRANYLCLRRWRSRAAAFLTDPETAHLASSILPWLAETLTGDRGELRLDREAHAAWQAVSAHDADCLRKQPREVREGTCFLERARRAADGSHLVIVNHALLLADAVHGGSAVPSHDLLIIDEAHNLEGVATQQLGATVSRRTIQEALEAVWRPGMRGRAPGGAAALLQHSALDALSQAGERLARAASSAADLATPLVTAVGRLLGRGSGDDRVLLSRAVRSSPEWADVESAWFAFDAALRALEAAGDEALRVAAATSPQQGDDLLADELLAAIAQVRALRETLARIVEGPNGDVTWAERDREGAGVLRSAPLAPGPLIAASLFEGRSAVIATSATLFPGRDVQYTLRALGLDDAEAVRLGSPFDYERAALLATVTDLPEPGAAGYLDAVADAIVRLASASKGRALVLFTSHESLRAVRDRAAARLRENGLLLLAQDVDGSPRQLIEQLRADPNTVVLGTASFWEGVDIRGEALSLLVITRLPFAVPTDPVFLARSELYDDPFNDYALPAAVLRFRQGFGRLIRHRDDRGVVAVLDRRLIVRPYGRAFLQALPACRQLNGSLDTVVRETQRWLAR